MKAYLRKVKVPDSERERLTKLICEHYGIEKDDKDVEILVRIMHNQNEYSDREFKRTGCRYVRKDYFPKYELSTSVGIKNYKDLLYSKYQEQQGAYLTKEEMFAVLDKESDRPLFWYPNGKNVNVRGPEWDKARRELKEIKTRKANKERKKKNIIQSIQNTIVTLFVLCYMFLLFYGIYWLLFL